MPGMKALRDAAPYLHQFRGQIFVVKLGGETMENPAVLKGVVEQLALLWHLGIKLVLVHGGGTAVDALSTRLGIKAQKVNGRRVTSPEALEVVKMTLKGSVQADLLGILGGFSLPAVGLTGLDAGMVVSTRRPPVEIDGKKVDFGHVGDVKRTDPALLQHLLAGGYLPVIAPLTASESGEVFNTNADTVAAEIAVALGAEKLFFVLKAPGVCRNVNAPETVIPFLTLKEAESLVAEGVAAGGMMPKIKAAGTALHGGVRAVQIVGAEAEDGLLREVFTNEGAGTMIQLGES
jgi:acetylglutamate kinase